MRRARDVYRTRRDHLVDALGRVLPELEVEGIAAGVHIVLRLPSGCDDVAIARSAREALIRVPPPSAFRIKAATVGGRVLGYGRLHEASVGRAVRAVDRVIRLHL